MLSVLCCVDDHFVSSVVYRAKASHDGRTVALKKVQIFEMMDSKARLDCMKEIQLLQVKL